MTDDDNGRPAPSAIDAAREQEEARRAGDDGLNELQRVWADSSREAPSTSDAPKRGTFEYALALETEVKRLRTEHADTLRTVRDLLANSPDISPRALEVFDRNWPLIKSREHAAAAEVRQLRQLAADTSQFLSAVRAARHMTLNNEDEWERLEELHNRLAKAGA